MQHLRASGQPVRRRAALTLATSAGVQIGIGCWRAPRADPLLARSASQLVCGRTGAPPPDLRAAGVVPIHAPDMERRQEG
ncbi:hypothetical protein NOCARDAX2BIS_250027 [Nocardioides sp. AX2bis]|nr:hypothetical protein NOCARDAX2BIS_250027 [Nocardioides sp. AX2bis]